MILAGLDVFANSLDFIVDRRGLLLEKTWEHVQLSIAALLIAIVIAVPIGIALGHLHRGSFLAVNVANIGRALPTLVVIAVGFTIFGIGYTNVIVALVILGVPPILTNAYVAVDEVDRDAVEAARGMGMTPFQVLRHVELPLALPLLFAGIRTAARLHRRDGDDRGDRRRRRARRHPRQPGRLPRRGAGRGGAVRLGARARRRRRPRPGAASRHAGWTETRSFDVRTGCAPGRLTG